MGHFVRSPMRVYITIVVCFVVVHSNWWFTRFVLSFKIVVISVLRCTFLPSTEDTFVRHPNTTDQPVWSLSYTFVTYISSRMTSILHGIIYFTDVETYHFICHHYCKFTDIAFTTKRLPIVHILEIYMAVVCKSTFIMRFAVKSLVHSDIKN